MKNVLAIGMCALLLAAGAMGCAAVMYRAPVIPPTGSAFNQTTAPMDTDFNSTEVGGMKRGEAAATSVLGLLSFGDASVGEAARNGGITTIEYADSKLLNVLGLYVQYTTTVYGR